jgi:predicted transporter
VIDQGRTRDYDVSLSDWLRAWSRDCDVAQYDWAAIPGPSPLSALSSTYHQNVFLVPQSGVCKHVKVTFVHNILNFRSVNAAACFATRLVWVTHKRVSNELISLDVLGCSEYLQFPGTIYLSS